MPFGRGPPAVGPQPMMKPRDKFNIVLLVVVMYIMGSLDDGRMNRATIIYPSVGLNWEDVENLHCWCGLALLLLILKFFLKKGNTS